MQGERVGFDRWDSQLVFLEFLTKHQKEKILSLQHSIHSTTVTAAGFHVLDVLARASA
jgi:hypothetical protein